MPSCRLHVLARSLFVFNKRQFFSIAVGNTAAIRKAFSQEDVDNFAKLCGDHNPIHVKAEFAKTTQFGRCIVHGALVNGLVSALLGTKLPGPGSIVSDQRLDFVSPLFVGEEVTAVVKVISYRKTIVETEFVCTVEKRNAIILKGTAKLLVEKFKRNETT